MTVDLGQLLLESGRIRPDQLEQALAHAASSGRGLDEAVTALDFVTEDQVADALGRHFEIPGLSLAKLPRPNPRVTRLIPEKVARERRIVPLERAGDTLILLMQDPTDIQTVNLIRSKGGVEVQPVVASAATLREALDTFYPSAEKRLLENAVPFVAKLITEEAARTYRALPVDRDGNLITVAMAGPDQEKIRRAIELATGLEVRPLVARWEDVERAIVRIHRAPAAPKPAVPAAQPPAAPTMQQAAVSAAPNPAGPPPAVAAPRAPAAAAAPAGPTVRSLDDLLGGGLGPSDAITPSAPAAARPAPAPSPRPSPVAPSGGGLSLDLGGEPAARPAAAAAAGPALSLDLGKSMPPPPSKPATPAASAGGGLSLDLEGGVEPRSAPAAPAARSPGSGGGGGGGGGLSLDLGSPAGPPPMGAPRVAPRPAGAPGGGNGGNGGHADGDSLLSSLLGADAPAPALPVGIPVADAKPSDGGLSLDELKRQAGSAGYLEDAGGPNLAASGGPEGPRTALKVTASSRDEMKALVARTWGELDLKAAKIVTEKLARTYKVVVTGRREKTLFVAMENPKDSFAIETLQFVSGLNIEATQASREAIDAGIEILYTADEDKMSEILDELEDVGLDDVMLKDELGELSDMDAASAAEAAPIVKLVSMLIDNAMKARASDIHFEIFEESMRIRYRVDGVLREVMRPPAQIRDPLISRIKIMGKMDISERRLPQDGRLRLRKGTGKGKEKKNIDFRISSVPTVFGEKVVMRILDRDQIRTDLRQLGLEGDQLDWIRDAIHKPFGMCLVVGPSGCGKTNTLYSALADVNRPDVNIITCEDPVEFGTYGLNQVQAKESIGLTFAAALRSFLRQDPNIILVGEVRDFETAEIAVKAALTGHMVLSTLHTNDAPACLNRLTNMGVEPFLIATSLHLIVAQRLVRRICDQCKGRDEKVKLEQLVQMGFSPDEARTVEPMRGLGCNHCEGRGYRGRTGLFEVMRVSNEMREMILYNGSQTEIKQLALRQGMRTLRASGLIKIKQGITTAEEVVRETIA